MAYDHVFCVVYHTYVFEMLLVLNICLAEVLTVYFSRLEKGRILYELYTKEDGYNNQD